MHGADKVGADCLGIPRIMGGNRALPGFRIQTHDPSRRSNPQNVGVSKIGNNRVDHSGPWWALRIEIADEAVFAGLKQSNTGISGPNPNLVLPIERQRQNRVRRQTRFITRLVSIGCGFLRAWVKTTQPFRQRANPEKTFSVLNDSDQKQGCLPRCLARGHRGKRHERVCVGRARRRHHNRGRRMESVTSLIPS